MALERFMVYSGGRDAGRVEVVFCWGFRAARLVARKLAVREEDAPVVTVDLDSLAETQRHALEAVNYRPAPGDPPLAGFVNTQPHPMDDRKSESAPVNPFVPELDVRRPRTLWARVA